MAAVKSNSEIEWCRNGVRDTCALSHWTLGEQLGALFRPQINPHELSKERLICHHASGTLLWTPWGPEGVVFQLERLWGMHHKDLAPMTPCVLHSGVLLGEPSTKPHAWVHRVIHYILYNILYFILCHPLHMQPDRISC